MAARVHLTRIPRDEIEGVLFLNRKRVHVGAQHNRGPLACSLDLGDYTGLCNTGAYRQSGKPRERIGDKCRRANLFKGQFRVGMDLSSQRDNGAEDESYTLMDPPYRAANGFLADTSELLLVKGVSVEDYNVLMFYVSALPGNSDINVNTASPQLLQSLTRDVTPPDVEGIIGIRTDSPYQDIDFFVEDKTFAGKEMSEEYLTVSSQYFLLTADVMLGNAPLTLQSLLHRSPEGNVNVMQRRFGRSRERILTQTDTNL